MDSLQEKLLPYKELIGKVASVLSIAQFFSGIFICKDIYDRKSTRGISAVPFVGAILIGILVLKYALILDDDAMLTVNIGVIIINTAYVIVYLYYSEDAWKEVFSHFLRGMALVVVVIGYAYIENQDKLEYRYGFIIMILQILLLASPLIDLANIISCKDASSIPFPLTFMAAIVTFLWFIYSIILNNIFMMVQNFISFFVCAIQLGLIFMYGSYND
ncbi:hypothetical protein WA026_012156 [Henosepilachna vigintioctopunctata]|uniref:Sugar transporter SWEET1 n=1 Tax=Henosepilachna vigintioctopunctata TaxID=420089 RepID=A0AAW1VD95_9CUCU